MFTLGLESIAAPLEETNSEGTIENDPPTDEGIDEAMAEALRTSAFFNITNGDLDSMNGFRHIDDVLATEDEAARMEYDETRVSDDSDFHSSCETSEEDGPDDRTTAEAYEDANWNESNEGNE
jgi:hypothetical protein